MTALTGAQKAAMEALHAGRSAGDATEPFVVSRYGRWESKAIHKSQGGCCAPRRQGHFGFATAEEAEALGHVRCRTCFKDAKPAAVKDLPPLATCRCCSGKSITSAEALRRFEAQGWPADSGNASGDPAAYEAWLDLVHQMCSFCDGTGREGSRSPWADRIPRKAVRLTGGPWNYAAHEQVPSSEPEKLPPLHVVECGACAGRAFEVFSKDYETDARCIACGAWYTVHTG